MLDRRVPVPLCIGEEQLNDAGCTYGLGILIKTEIGVIIIACIVPKKFMLTG